MNVGAQSHIVGEIPSSVVGIFVNCHVVAVPIPVIAVCKVERGDSEVVAAKPETAGIAALDPPAVPAPEPTIKAAVFPGMVNVKTVVVAAKIVPHPFAVVVDVRGFGMIVAVAVGMPVVVAVVFMPVAVVAVVMISCRPATRNVPTPDVVVTVVSVVMIVSLGERGKREDEGGG